MDKFNSLMTCFMLVFFTSLMGVILLWFEKEMGDSLIDDLRKLRSRFVKRIRWESLTRQGF